MNILEMFAPFVVLVQLLSPISGLPSFIINEVGANFNEHSFIELYSPTGISKETPLHFGVAVVQSSEGKGKVVAMFEFPKDDFEEEPFYFTIGTPKDNWFSEGSSKKGIPIRGRHRPYVKIFGSFTNWLDVDYMFAIILVQSTTPFTDVWPTLRGNERFCYLERKENLKTFLLSNQIDGLILKNHEVVRTCRPLDDIIKHKLSPRYVFVTLGTDWASPFSNNKCKTLIPYDQSAYLDGTPTPGMENDCTKPVWNVDITNFLNVVPSTVEQTNPCGNHHVDMRTISEDQVNGADLAMDHYNTISSGDQTSSSNSIASSSSADNPTTSNSWSINNNMLGPNIGKSYIAVKKGEAKRARVAAGIDNLLPANSLPASPLPANPLPANPLPANPLPANPLPANPLPANPLPANPPPMNTLSPTELQRKTKVEEAAKIIKEFQSDKLNGQIIQDRYWRWFQYLHDEFEPEDSKFNCEFCAKHLKNTRHSNALSGEDGILHNGYETNMGALRRHEALESHRIAMQQETRELANQLGFVIEQEVKRQEDEANKITNRHFKVVYYSVHHYISFNSHPSLVELLETEADMGKGCKTPKSAKRMSLFMSRLFKEDLFTIMRKSTSPIFLICDGSEDLSQNHFFVTIFQWVDNGVVRTEFYRLIELGVGEGANDLVDAFMAKVEEDGITDIIQRLLGVVTDGASVMVGEGKDGGFTKNLKQRLNKQHLVIHHCLPHRIQLIVRSAVTKSEKVPIPNSRKKKTVFVYPNGMHLESDIDSLASYHRVSHKNMAHLKKVCRAAGARVFRPPHIFPTRWVTSSYRATHSVDVHWPLLIMHLTAIYENRRYPVGQRVKARKLLLFLKDKHALTTMMYQMDMQYLFKGLSELFQRNGESVIGQKARKRRLKDGLDQCELEQGKHLHKFLSEVLCLVESSIDDEGDPVWQNCNTLANFETASKVKWHDIELTEGRSLWKPIEAPAFEEPTFNAENMDLQEFVIDERTAAAPYVPLSTFKESYTTTIREKIEFYLGDDKLMKVANSLDQLEWPSDLTKIKDSDELMEGFRLWPEIFKYDQMTPEIMDQEVDELIRQLTDPESQIKWVDILQSDATSFWSLLLTDGNLSPNMRLLVESTLAMPYGSAQAERFFSLMNLIKHKRRAMLSPHTLDVLMRVKLHDDSIKTLDVNKITSKYLLHHQKCDKGWSRQKKFEEYDLLDEPFDEPFGFDEDRRSIIRDVLGDTSDSVSSCSSESESSSDDDDLSSDSDESSSDDDESSSENEHSSGTPGGNQCIQSCSQWAAQCVAHDHEYLYNRNNPRLLEKSPNEILISFRNWDGSKVLSVHNERIVVKAFQSDDNSQKWFMRDKHIVAYNGKVLQVTGENRPIVLAYYDPQEIKQKWRIQRIAERRQAIISSFNNLRMDIINKNSFHAMHLVVAKRLATYFNRESQQWLGIVFTE